MALNPTAELISKNIQKTVDGRFDYVYNSVLPRSLFSIESNFVELNPSLVRPYTEGR